MLSVNLHTCKSQWHVMNKHWTPHASMIIKFTCCNCDSSCSYDFLMTKSHMFVLVVSSGESVIITSRFDCMQILGYKTHSNFSNLIILKDMCLIKQKANSKFD